MHSNISLGKSIQEEIHIDISMKKHVEATNLKREKPIET